MRIVVGSFGFYCERKGEGLLLIQTRKACGELSEGSTRLERFSVVSASIETWPMKSRIDSLT